MTNAVSLFFDPIKYLFNWRKRKAQREATRILDHAKFHLYGQTPKNWEAIHIITDAIIRLNEERR